MAEPLEYPVSAPGFDALLDQLRLGEVYAKAFDAAMAKVSPILKMAADGAKAFESQTKAMNDAVAKQAAQAAKAAKTSEEQAAALEKMAAQAELAATRLNSTGRSQELLIKIGGQYASILRETGTAQSELMKTWQAGLSPAENSARKLVLLSAKTEESILKTEAASVAVGELSDRLADQVRRQDENTQGNNKLSRSLTYLIKEQTEALQTTQVLTAVYARQKQQLDAVETAMSALGVPGADLVARGKQMADAFETASEHMSDGAQTALKYGLALGATVAAAAAAVAGVAAMGAAIVGVVAKGKEWNDELAKVGEGLNGLAADRLGAASASIDAVGMSMKAVGVAIAETFGPVVKAGAVQLTALGLAAADGWRAMWAGKDVVETISTWIGQKLVGAITFGIKAIMGLAGGVAELGKALHLPGAEAASDALDRFAAQLQDLEDEQVAGVSAALQYMGRAALDPLTSSTEGYLSRAEKMVGALAKQESQAKKVAETQVTQLIPAYRETATSIAMVSAALEPAVGLYGEIAKSQEVNYAALQASIEATQEWENAIASSGQTLAETMTQFKEVMSQTFAPIGDFLGSAVGAGTSLINTVIQQATGMDLWSLLLENGANAGQVLETALAGVDFTVMLSGLADGFVQVLGTLNNPAIWTSILDGVMQAISILGSSAGPMIGELAITMIEALVAALPVMLPALIEAGVAIAVGIVKAVPVIVTALASAMPEIVVELVRALVENLPTLIVAIVEAIPIIVRAIVVGVGALLMELIAMALDALGLDKQADSIRGMVAAGTSTTSTSPTSSTWTGTSQTGGATSVNKTATYEVSDAYLGVSGSPRLIRDTPGDVTQSYQAGGPNDPAVHARQGNAIAAAMLGVLQEMLQLMRANRAESTGSTSGARSAGISMRGAAMIA